MEITKNVLEKWLGRALSELVEHEGGSIESALDHMVIRKEEERKAIKKWFGWDDEEELPEEDEIARPNYIDNCDKMEKYIRNYLKNEYDVEPVSFDFSFDMRKVYIENIEW